MLVTDVKVNDPCFAVLSGYLWYMTNLMQIILAILKSKILSTLSGSQENNFDVRSKRQRSFHNGGL